MTLLLEPILIRTATASGAPAGSVRIVWVTSLLQAGTPPGGMSFQADGTPVILTKFMANYMQSKVGDAWLADHFAKRLGEHRILSVVRWKFLIQWACANKCAEPSPGVDENRVAETLDSSTACDYGMIFIPPCISRDIR